MLRKIGELWVRNDRPVRVTPVTESGEESGAGRMAGRRVTRFRRLSRLRRRRPHCDRLALKFAAMPVPTHVQHEKNIWVAAGDGDERSGIRNSLKTNVGLRHLAECPSWAQFFSQLYRQTFQMHTHTRQCMLQHRTGTFTFWNT